MELNSIGYIYPRVVETTDWLDLEKYKELEGGIGVFIFSDFFFQVKYVGRVGTEGLVSVISNAIRDGKSKGSTKVKVLYTKSEKQALQLENELIIKYHPIKNLK